MTVECLSQAANFPVDGNGVVLVYTGTFAPIHAGHVDAMKAAASTLHDRDKEVDAAIFVPKHDLSLKAKLGGVAHQWSFENRVSTIVTCVPTLESMPPLYVDDITGRDTYHDTVGSEALRTMTQLGVAAARAVMVVGSDRIDTAKTLLPSNTVICVRRPRYMNEIEQGAAKHPWLREAIASGAYIITDPEDATIVTSSSQIRAQLQKERMK